MTRACTRTLLVIAGGLLLGALGAGCKGPECDGSCIVFGLIVDLEDGRAVDSIPISVDGPPRMRCEVTGDALLCTTDSIPQMDYTVRVSAPGYISEERFVRVTTDECCVVSSYNEHISLRPIRPGDAGMDAGG